jgi:hypothetical protein
MSQWQSSAFGGYAVEVPKTSIPRLLIQTRGQKSIRRLRGKSGLGSRESIDIH